ncbi:2-dehydropantoate 2-reductase [uncultured Pleomorphomonas sp.]|uniref:2-dehydropantoate 2-reductase n=1 Tax=uncultured Pleomorphomonas sp. TaxID=442121 RepID=A0A212LDP7_9HYPH|nr:2-dehydropantoate 2-reductase [uncultured Pleomorphomonas sp.]SCM75617.1 2-dehydropantoate 2-reductase [uncultured Pleomorphomonas sp.]
MRLLVVGAGATGGYFGGRLAAAGRDVTFLIRPKRAAEIARNGFVIVDPKGETRIEPKIVTADALKGPYDLVLISVKAYSLPVAIEDIAPAIGPNTLILPVLNGLKHFDLLSQRFGPARVIGSFCKINARLDDHGRIVQMSPLHDLIYGEYDGSRTPRMEAIDAFFKGAGFDARLSDDVGRELWEKWVLLASLGAANCLMRGTIGDIVARPGGRAFIEALLDEVTAVATAHGKAPDPAYLDATRKLLTTPDSPMTASMYRDLTKGLPVENDEILDDLLARAAAVGVKTPYLHLAAINLGIYAARRLAE